MVWCFDVMQVVLIGRNFTGLSWLQFMETFFYRISLVVYLSMVLVPSGSAMTHQTTYSLGQHHTLPYKFENLYVLADCAALLAFVLSYSWNAFCCEQKPKDTR